MNRLGLDATGRWIHAVARHGPQCHTGSIHSWAFPPYCRAREAEREGSHTAIPSRPWHPRLSAGGAAPQALLGDVVHSPIPTPDPVEGEPLPGPRRGFREV